MRRSSTRRGGSPGSPRLSSIFASSNALGITVHKRWRSTCSSRTSLKTRRTTVLHAHCARAKGDRTKCVRRQSAYCVESTSVAQASRAWIWRGHLARSRCRDNGSSRCAGSTVLLQHQEPCPGGSPMTGDQNAWVKLYPSLGTIRPGRHQLLRNLRLIFLKSFGGCLISHKLLDNIVEDRRIMYCNE